MHGMSLEEIEKLLLLANKKDADHAEIHSLIQTHIVNIQRQITELEQLKDSLENLMKNCTGSGEHCDILKSLGSQNLCEYCKKRVLLPTTCAPKKIWMGGFLVEVIWKDCKADLFGFNDTARRDGWVFAINSHSEEFFSEE